MSFSANEISLRPGEVEMKILQSWRQALPTSPPAQSCRGSRPNLARDPNNIAQNKAGVRLKRRACSQATSLRHSLIYVSPTPQRKLGSVIILLCLLRAKSIMTVIAPRTMEMRQFKHFQNNKFLRDLEQMPWSNVDQCSDPNVMWEEWKQKFVSCIDKHAPRNLKRNNKSGLRGFLERY